jgi:hypothetical protein
VAWHAGARTSHNAPTMPVEAGHAATAFGYAAAGSPTATSRRRAPSLNAYRWFPRCTIDRMPAVGSASRSHAAAGPPRPSAEAPEIALDVGVALLVTADL